MLDRVQKDGHYWRPIRRSGAQCLDRKARPIGYAVENLGAPRGRFSVWRGAITETTHRVMAAVFDGDSDPLYQIILDPKVDEFVRSRMCEALAMATFDDQTQRADAARFLRACHSELMPQAECFVWNGWQSQIALLGLAEFRPLVEQAFARGLISPSWLAFADFEQDLELSLENPAALPHRSHGEFSLFGDTIEELSNWYCFSSNAQGM